MNLRTSAIARLVAMGVLWLALLIPLMMVQSVVAERASRRYSVAAEVSGTWGGPQTIGGPVLVVPYRYVVTDNSGRREERAGYASFLPDVLEVDGVLEPEERKRGLFKVIVYKAHLKVSGRFARPDLAALTGTDTQARWNDATLNVGIADPRGISRRPVVTWNGGDIAFVPGAADTGLFASGLHASIPGLESLPAGSMIPFSLDLDVNGSRDFLVLPSGNDTSVRLSSAWPHPSFTGASLPDSRTIGGSGFTAAWRVPYFGRGYAPAWIVAGLDREKLKTQAETSGFGVSLVQPVDIYQQAERAVKYASLFIVLTFTIFFLCEIAWTRLLHPVQYLFVGFAMCVFYLLLVSISEHVGFDAAYACAAGATTILIASYSTYALGGLREGALIGSGLASLYSFLYLLLRLEDYALLAGSIGLFVMLALLMYATRRVNWYELRLGSAEESAEGS
jgi:inner membrane protein